MKESKLINRYIPHKVNEHLKNSTFKNQEHLIIICDMINRISIFRKEDIDYSNQYVDIPKSYFRDIIANSTSLKESMDYLKDNKIIECDGIYSKDKGKSLGYKINDEYFSKLIQVKVSKPTLTKKICSNINKEKNLVNDKLKKYKSFFLKNFRLNYKKSLNFISNSLNSSLCGTNSIQDNIKLINKYNHMYMAINAINDGDLFFRHNKTNGRIDTNLTNLKSDLKQFISISGMVQVDIVNSQPYILSLYLNSSLCSRNSIKNDFEKYINWTSKGVFYENFQKEYYTQKGKLLSRKEIKDIMFCILYSKNQSYKKEKEVFKSIFPNVYDCIEKEKNTKHNQLAIKMQKLESEICIDIICQELDKNNINYFTIHDAWLVDKFDEIKVRQIVEDCFMKKYSSIPKLKIEKITV